MSFREPIPNPEFNDDFIIADLERRYYQDCYEPPKPIINRVGGFVLRGLIELGKPNGMFSGIVPPNFSNPENK